ncbi:MAG: SWIM zinc finger family protein, partial [Cellulomonadaceae bacterium]
MFTRDDVADLVGPGAYARGEDYADRGMVMTVARNSAGTTIVGQVRGSGTAQYVTVVQLSGPGPQAVPRSSRCSCPVGASCKHAAATLLTYLQRREPRPASALAVPGAPPEASSSTSPGMLPGPAWEQAFAQLLDPSRSVPPRDRPGVVRRGADQVGLQFELQPPRPQVSVRRRGGREPAGTEPRLGMRPVLRGASGRWVRTGISWRDLGHYGFVARTLPEAQLEALRSLYGLATASLDRAYYDPPALIFADEMPGSALFSVLEDAIGAGVPLLRSDRRQSPVTLAAPAQTVLRLASVPHGLVVTAAVLSGGERCDPERTVLLGHPASGMFRWLGTASAQAVGKETDVVLGRLATPADDIVRGLLTQSAPLLVPAADADRFLVRVLPELRRRVDDVLVDAAIELPEPPQPTLCLEVTRLPDHRARLAWSWRYRTRVGQVPEAAESVLTATLGDSPAGTIRDVVVEQRILARVAARVPRLRSVLDRVGAGAHAGTGAEGRRGMDTARVFTAVVPELTAGAEQDPD